MPHSMPTPAMFSTTPDEYETTPPTAYSAVFVSEMAALLETSPPGAQIPDDVAEGALGTADDSVKC